MLTRLQEIAGLSDNIKLAKAVYTTQQKTNYNVDVSLTRMLYEIGNSITVLDRQRCSTSKGINHAKSLETDRKHQLTPFLAADRLPPVRKP